MGLELIWAVSTSSRILPNTPQPSLTDRLHASTIMQFSTHKTYLQWDSQAQYHMSCRKLPGTWQIARLGSGKYSKWLRKMGGKRHSGCYWKLTLLQELQNFSPADLDLTTTLSFQAGLFFFFFFQPISPWKPKQSSLMFLFTEGSRIGCGSSLNVGSSHSLWILVSAASHQVQQHRSRVITLQMLCLRSAGICWRSSPRRQPEGQHHKQ